MNRISISLSALMLLTAMTLAAQPLKLTRGQKGYLSKYESSTLSGNTLPVLMPFNRWIDPAGDQLYFGDKEDENHALDCSASPDGRWIAVEGRYSVVLIDPQTKQIVYRLVLRKAFPKDGLANTFSGIAWHKKGEQYELFWSAAGRSKAVVVQAEWNGKKLSVITSFPFAAEKPAASSLPNEILVAEESEHTILYVVLNGNNKLVKLDVATGKVIWSVPTGVAPFGITQAGGKLYVTNWAGGVPASNDPDVAGVPWGAAKVNPKNGSTREGSVSVFDPQSGKLIKEILVELHPNDIISSPDQHYVYVANANSDQVSVIRTDREEVVETISVRLMGEKNGYFGDSPNGLAISSDGKNLYVANGLDHALAVVNLGANASTTAKEQTSHVAGFIPTGAYPGGVALYQNNLLFVANIEAEGARIPFADNRTKNSTFNSHRMMASVSVIQVPNKKELQHYTERVEKSNQLFRLALDARMARKNVPSKPLPERIGEPSLIKHILYIIKENRTYDQVLGDVRTGNGDSSLCVFGQKITPNMHKLCQEYLLLDNYHASGKCSAEGHQWTDMGIVTDYVEKSVRAWFRSYPHVQYDALVYAPNGFIWNNALEQGRRVRIYGEACDVEFDKNLGWAGVYDKYLKGEKLEFKNITTIKPVEAILSPNFASGDSHQIPDVMRARAFAEELKAYEKQEGDQWPELMVMALSNDHTAGTRPGVPTPRALVADNDAALGQIVEAVSKSRFWENTAIFITEDDSQDGWDHVSAYRTVGLIVSPYTHLQKTISTNYNQVSMFRTIEQILGLPLMNSYDATAMPMFDCFAATPDFTPYQAVPNQIPLNEMNKSLSELNGKALHFARKSMEPQFDHIDAGDDDLFNRIIWFAMKGKQPYPSRYSGRD